MNRLIPLCLGSLLTLNATFSVANASLVTSLESFDSGVQDWSTDLTTGGFGSTTIATVSQIATGGEDGGAYISQTADIFLVGGPSSFGPQDVVFRCNNAGVNCSGGSFFGDYDPDNNNTTISFYLRHNAGVDLDFFARLTTVSNFPGAGTDILGTVASDTWTQLSFDIEANEFTSFSGTDFDTVFSNIIERLQIGVIVPFNPAAPNFGATQGFELNNVTYDLDTVALSNTAVPLPASAWLFGSALFGLAAKSRRK